MRILIFSNLFPDNFPYFSRGQSTFIFIFWVYFLLYWQKSDYFPHNIWKKKIVFIHKKQKLPRSSNVYILILLWCWHIKLFPDIIVYFERSTLFFPSSWNKYSRNQRDIILAKSSIHMRHCLYYLFSFLPIYLLSPKKL